MQKNSILLADTLTKKIRQIDNLRAQIELLAASKHLSQRAATQFYEGLFLSAHVAFENFLEELFIGLLLHNKGVKSSRNDIIPRLKIHSHKVVRDLLFTKQKPYIDWFPFQRTTELAEKYFRGGRPFSDLLQSEKDYLSKCHALRNVIAHDSRDSRDKFQKRVIGSTALLPHEKKPAGYLRGLYRVSPNQTRFENYMVQLLIIARKLAQ